MTTFTTNVPAPTLGPSGFAIPTESQVLIGVIADIQAAFGGTLNLSATSTSSLATPQGQLATTFAAIISDCYAQLLAVTSQVDPQYAQGLMQDGIGNIYMMQRYQATGTIVPATVIGLPGTVIPTGVAVATDANNNLYTCATSSGTAVTIGSGGNAAAIFTNMATGPIIYPATGMFISQIVPGWDSIVTSTPITLGANIENAQQFETRRQLSVAVNASNTVQSIKAAILALTPTTSSGIPGTPPSVYVVDNPSNAVVITGGITLPANSVFVCTNGYPLYVGTGAWAASTVTTGAGTTTIYTPLTVATAVWMKKSLGCSYAPSAIFTGSSSGAVLTVGVVSSGAIATGQTLLTAGSNLPYLTATGAVVMIGSLASPGVWNLVTATGGSATPATPIGGGTTLWSATTYAVTDPSYSTAPLPTYYVSFSQPASLPIYIQVTLALASNPPSSALTTLQASTGLAAAFTGADGFAPVSAIGQTTFSSRFYSTVAALLPGVNIVSILVSNSSSFTSSSTQVTCPINQIPTMLNPSAQITLLEV